MSVPDPFYLRLLILARKVSVPFLNVWSRDFVGEPRAEQFKHVCYWNVRETFWATSLARPGR